MEPEPSVKRNPSLLAIGQPLKALDYIRRYGMAGFVAQLHHRLATWHGERKFGVSTSGFIEFEELGIQNPDAKAYGAGASPGSRIPDNVRRLSCTPTIRRR